MFVIPKEKEVPFAGCTPAPVKDQRMMITGNWRTYRPVINHEECNLCLNCVMYCPDACWQLSEDEERVVWNNEFCKGCLICVNECTSEALSKAHELDFEGGVIRLDKPF
jgi:2-oxoacid:acceptor oxidoreductase delta subunit (pyruvate/2-ketoisovalerate family)